MPLYEYECQACHKRTEKIQKFSDPEITECPQCGGKLERVLHAPAFSLKGGGWYSDLYSSAKPKTESKSDGGSGEAAASGKDSSATKESAPAAPAASATPAASAPASGSSAK